MRIIDKAKVELIRPGLIKTEYPEGALFNSHHLENIREVYSQIAGTDDLSNFRLLVVFQGKIEMSRDVAERYLVADRHRPKIAEAFVVNDQEALELINAASAILQGKHPIKVFHTEEAAINWLSEH